MRQVLGAGALGRPRGIGWRGRWEGGSGWGIHVNPWLIHVKVWKKPLQYFKVISFQLIKINGKKLKNKKIIKINKWSHTICGLSYLTSFTEPYVLKVHSNDNMYQYFISF